MNTYMAQGTRPTSAPLSVWTTGAPVPPARRVGGTFFDMITRPIRSELDCGFVDLDCTTLCSEADMQKALSEPTCGVIISGSPAFLSDQAEWMHWTMEALALLHDRKVPLLGICFGHQLLGQVLGGRVARNPNGREIGTLPLRQVEADPLLHGLSGPQIVVMTHLDSVVQAPPGARILASTDLEPHAALRFSETSWGVQFHPEMTAEIGGCYLTERRETIELEGIDVAELLRTLTPSSFGAELLIKFARFCLNGGQFV